MSGLACACKRLCKHHSHVLMLDACPERVKVRSCDRRSTLEGFARIPWQAQYLGVGFVAGAVLWSLECSSWQAHFESQGMSLEGVLGSVFGGVLLLSWVMSWRCRPKLWLGLSCGMFLGYFSGDAFGCFGDVLAVVLGDVLGDDLG